MPSARKLFVVHLLAAALAMASLACDDGSVQGDSIECAAIEGNPRPIPEAKLYFEYQSVDTDTGIHGMFDTAGFSELCVIAPDGTKFLAAQPQGNLRAFTIGGFFFESREPKASEVSQDEVLAQFPAGSYEVIGKAFSGESLTGTATLTHEIPAPAVITAPAADEVVDPSNLVITWEPVTKTVKGNPVTITGYEVIVTNEDKDGADPNGMSHPIASIHVIPSVHRLTIPSEFLESATLYELELIAIEQSGNQTISVLFFRTP